MAATGQASEVIASIGNRMPGSRWGLPRNRGWLGPADHPGGCAL